MFQYLTCLIDELCCGLSDAYSWVEFRKKVFRYSNHVGFEQEFGLIDRKELAPLQELIESIIVPYWGGGPVKKEWVKA